MGFKRKAARFVKEEAELKSSVFLERSSWNSVPQHPDELSVFIEVSDDLGPPISIKLFRTTDIIFPEYYAPFFQDVLDWPAKTALMASFSAEQVQKIDKYLASISWMYDSEDSLIGMLQEIKKQLAIVGLPTISYIKERFYEEGNLSKLITRMQYFAHGLYLEQLDPLSRFPNE